MDAVWVELADTVRPATYPLRMASSGQNHKIELTPGLYPELNATLYASEPAAYFRMRVASLLMMLTNDEQLAPVHEAEAEIGALRVSGGTLPAREDRERFVAMESTVLFHHATETLLRLFFAHHGNPGCPWLQVVNISTPKEFKEQTERLLERGLARTDVAQVFLGGGNSDDAGIDLPEDDFDAGIEGYVELLTYCAKRYLADSFVYNSAKHGLSGVPLSGMTLSVQRRDNEDPINVMGGNVIASLQKKATPGQKARKHQAEWYTAMTNVLTDQDLLVVEMIGRAIDSLWSVARRRYTGVPGAVNLFDKTAVQAIIVEPVRAAGQYVRAVVYELPTTTTYKNGNQKVSGIEVNLHASLIPRDYVESRDVEGDRTIYGTPRSVELPVRTEDQRAPSDSGTYLLPFSPNGSQQVDDAT